MRGSPMTFARSFRWGRRDRFNGHLDGEPRMERGIRLLGTRFDEKDELRPILAAVDNRWRVFRLRRDEGDVGHDWRAAAIAANGDRRAAADRRQRRLRNIEADLHVARR